MAPNGSDSNPGTITAPWRTISASSAKLRPGDTLYARGGTYTGQASVSWRSPSGTASAPITWKAYPGETPVFDGQAVGSNFMTIVATDWLIFDGITIKNYRGCCGAIWIGYSGSGSDYAENNAIRNMTISDIGNANDQYHGTNTHGIYVSYGNRNIEISGNTILRVTGAGIHAYHDPGLDTGRIFNNVIDGQDIGTWGIVLRNATNVQVYNNTIINARPYNSDGGSDIDDSGSTNVTIRNNILSLPIEGTTGATCSNNLFIDDANGNPSSPNCGANNVKTPSAGFVNASANDYHLTSKSPAVDKGSTIPSVTVDMDGVSRPQGAAYDIGACEFVTSGNGPSTVAPAISLSPSTLSFASQIVGTTSAVAFSTVTNTGSGALDLSANFGIKGDFAFGNVGTCADSLAPGDSCTISVTFTPTAAGTRTGQVTIYDNAPGSPHVLPLTATGTLQ
jgi:hypothetical protein